MDNSETLSTLGKQDTGRRQTKQKHKTENKNKIQQGLNSRAREG